MNNFNFRFQVFITSYFIFLYTFIVIVKHYSIVKNCSIYRSSYSVNYVNFKSNSLLLIFDRKLRKNEKSFREKGKHFFTCLSHA